MFIGKAAMLRWNTLMEERLIQYRDNIGTHPILKMGCVRAAYKTVRQAGVSPARAIPILAL
jgi:hypothetical protein